MGETLSFAILLKRLLSVGRSSADGLRHAEHDQKSATNSARDFAPASRRSAVLALDCFACGRPR